MMPFGLGHRPDEPHIAPTLPTVHALIAAAPAAAAARPYEFIRQIRDQRGTGSCVGQALSQGFACRARATGFDVPELSALAIYRMARQGEQPVVDEGSQPWQACTYAMSHGLVPDARWPLEFGADGWTSTNVNAPLPLDVWEHALEARLSSVGTVDLADQGAVQAAIDAGFPVAWATVVDASFDGYTSGYLPPPSGPVRGSHYTLIVDYDALGVVVVNSWGLGWGAAYAGFSGGFYRASWARLADPTSVDGRVLEVGPREVS